MIGEHWVLDEVKHIAYNRAQKRSRSYDANSQPLKPLSLLAHDLLRFPELFKHRPDLAA